MINADKRKFDLKRKTGNRDIRDLCRILTDIGGEEQAKEKMKEFGFEKEVEKAMGIVKGGGVE